MPLQPRIRGLVSKGKGRGKKLGFPTANIKPINPRPNLNNGVYASLIKVNKQIYQSVTHVGPAETFDESEKKIETYIFNFDQSIYEKEVWLELVKYLRAVQKFENVSVLVEQIKEDCKNSKDFFNEIS
jgi:riboflavin kinase/FMN adenylyltransferase